ncbi:PIG-L deacetylase family protein [Burkholderia sp. L27(2015)]|uniref:PIG-L deacetylase family protein n=1 Tax=Burkholderia sp. L27(2015) TaxID=1641858 RepID=UPI00131B2B5F|nr:PIG-L family deacetylase [Burkholderia sp. L27(2015)]
MSSANTSLLIVSPHFDDAVFSCADWMARQPDVLVGTVFTATPAGNPMHTEWDARCGFADAEQAMRARIAEDDRALSLLHAHPLRLGFLDRQYGERPAVDAVAQAIDVLVLAYRCGAVMIPLGLCHPDHDLVHRACLRVLKANPQLRWLGYEEAPYRRVEGLVQGRLIMLADNGIVATPFAIQASVGGCSGNAACNEVAELTRQAVAAYRSQLLGFDAPDTAEFYLPGRYWTLVHAPAGLRAATRNPPL